MLWTVERALEYWQKQGLLTADKARELQGSLATEGADGRSGAIRIFSAIGSVLVGLGVILFISSNWSALTPTVKTGLLLVGMIATGGVGYWLTFEKKMYERTGMGLLFVNIFIYGASIFLIGQIYHLPLAFWWGALLWFLGTALLGYILQSRLHVWLAVPLLVLFLGWWRTAFATGMFSEFDFLTDGRMSLVPYLPIIGLGVLSMGIILRKWLYTQFSSLTLFHWGIFLMLFTFVIATFDKQVANFILTPWWDMQGSVMTIASFLLVITALMFAPFETRNGKMMLLGLALFIAVIYALLTVPGSTEPFNSTPLFVGYVLIAFALQMLLVWYGTLLRMPSIINMGMVGIAVTIFGQYISWAFQMLDRSIAFIIGGVLILAVSALLERKRRTILSTIQSA